MYVWKRLHNSDHETHVGEKKGHKSIPKTWQKYTYLHFKFELHI